MLQAELHSSVRSPREVGRVVDAEWVGSDRPLLATADGALHLTDLTLKKASSPFDDLELPGK